MTALTTINHNPVTTADTAPLPLRAHTILGVCEALGEDFGINPIWLRVPLAASVLISPMWSVVAYFALGLVVLGSRLIAPNIKSVPNATTVWVFESTNSADEIKLAA
ncbi:MAG: PspC domain-containing protein [Sphingomonas sp.]|nr:PspC domain-containing protein [Sphingomonas sp.]